VLTLDMRRPMVRRGCFWAAKKVAMARELRAMSFVDQMSKINRGRAFFATPERLGEYILVDYVKQKRRTQRNAS
jgi:uncharacterized protein with von Willebrand factor type A (vWA) domain